MVTVIVNPDEENGCDVMFAMDCVEAARDEKNGITVAFIDHVTELKVTVWLDEHLIKEMLSILQEKKDGVVEVLDPRRFDNPFEG